MAASEFDGMTECDVHEVRQLRAPFVILTAERFIYCCKADAEFFGVEWQEGSPNV